MQRTGLYQHARNFTDNDIATGYGYSSVGTVNSPKYWGNTSWLMVGAGGMVSNPSDLYKFARAMRDGKLLSSDSLEKYRRDGIKAGSCDRGFLCFWAEARRNMLFFSSNSDEPLSGETKSLGKALARLVSTG